MKCSLTKSVRSSIWLWFVFASQVDRQQTRIRSLIEEQDCKVDEERTLIERRAQEQVRQAREESETQAGNQNCIYTNNFIK